MAWKKEKSRERIERIAEGIPEIAISDLTREMNLENVTLGRPKRIRGVHLYQGLANEQRLIDDILDAEDQDAARAPVRRVHLLQREVARIVRDFDAAQVHFQSTRLHALTYRPVSDEAEIVGRAVTMACAIDLMVRKALNPALPDDPDLVCVAGASYGSVLATRSGARGDSELLFVGDPANRGAKAIDATARLRVTPEICVLLDPGLGVEPADQGDGHHALSMSEEAIDAAVERFGIDWSLDRSRRRVEDDAEAIPLDAIKISKATAEIDKGALGPSNTKLNEAISAFGDLDGFTAIVEGAASDEERAKLVRDFHVMRAELRHVAVQDVPPTLRVQYQGDRIQVLRHLPHDDAEARALAIVEVAAGWQSSMTETLPEFLHNDAVKLATGLAAGPTVVTKVGRRGNRDVVALGRGVRRAERIQRNLDGDEVGIDGEIYELLPEDLAAKFGWRAGTQGYVAEDLRANELAYALEASSLDHGEPQRVTAGEVASVGLALGAAGLAGAAANRAAARERNATPRRRWAP